MDNIFDNDSACGLKSTHLDGEESSLLVALSNFTSIAPRTEAISKFFRTKSLNPDYWSGTDQSLVLKYIQENVQPKGLKVGSVDDWAFQHGAEVLTTKTEILVTDKKGDTEKLVLAPIPYSEGRIHMEVPLAIIAALFEYRKGIIRAIIPQQALADVFHKQSFIHTANIPRLMVIVDKMIQLSPYAHIVKDKTCKSYEFMDLWSKVLRTCPNERFLELHSLLLVDVYKVYRVEKGNTIVEKFGVKGGSAITNTAHVVRANPENSGLSVEVLLAIKRRRGFIGFCRPGFKGPYRNFVGNGTLKNAETAISKSTPIFGGKKGLGELVSASGFTSGTPERIRRMQLLASLALGCDKPVTIECELGEYAILNGTFHNNAPKKRIGFSFPKSVWRQIAGEHQRKEIFENAVTISIVPPTQSKKELKTITDTSYDQDAMSLIESLASPSISEVTINSAMYFKCGAVYCMFTAFAQRAIFVKGDIVPTPIGYEERPIPVSLNIVRIKDFVEWNNIVVNEINVGISRLFNPVTYRSPISNVLCPVVAGKSLLYDAEKGEWRAETVETVDVSELDPVVDNDEIVGPEDFEVYGATSTSTSTTHGTQNTTTTTTTRPKDDDDGDRSDEEVVQADAWETAAQNFNL